MAEKIEVSPALIPYYKEFFDLLIITATPIEKTELHQYLEPIDGQTGVIRIQKDQYTYFLGKFGHYNAIHVATGTMGMSGRTASIHTAMTAVELWNPKAVLMVGIAFGGDPSKMRIGDVLVSERVVNYGPQRANNDGSATYRGAEGPASSLLLDRFRSVEDWEFTVSFQQNSYKAKQLAGLLLSGEILLDDPKLKEKLMKEYPTAIGGEMEGAGIYTACEGQGKHWIIVKAVCDFGDGTKGTDPNKDLYQEIAVKSSVSLCHKVFSGKFSFEDIGLYAGSIKIESGTEIVAEPKKLEDELSDQLKRQLSKQKASQKYIPRTFIEIGDNKELLRYFCAPVSFLPKLLNELSVMDFTEMNNLLKKKGHPNFAFDVSKWVLGVKILLLDQLQPFIKEIQAYVQPRVDELVNPPIAVNSVRSFSYKLEYAVEHLNWFSRKVCLIKEDAGQGKTNFLCDLVENFILKRGIPAVFLLGTDLDPQDIRASILKKIFPNGTDLTFASFLSELEVRSKVLNQPFILIIDGLNENPNPEMLSRNLENFITEITEKDFIRVIVSCRSEYYNTHFRNFNKAAFSENMVETRSLRIYSDDIAADKIFWSYMDFFDIKIATYNTDVFKQLTENFLLLRIFCDSHRGERIQYLASIQKQTLFQQYYQNMVEEITKRMGEDDELRVMGKIDIRRFLQKLVDYMIGHKQYENIPFDELLSSGDNHKVYVRFLDENILVRRDPKINSSVFSNQEMVNFTFDEFRDFLIADYLVSTTYTKDPVQFEDFVANEINPASRILEGCGTFLFYIARKSQDAMLKEIIERQKWVPSIFLKCVFTLEDKYVTAEDRQEIFKFINSKGRPAISLFYQFLRRHNIKEYPNLNLDHYLQFLRSLDSVDYRRLFNNMFTDREYSISGQIEQRDFLNNYRIKLDESSGPLVVKKFEMLIYLFTNSSAEEVYEVYELFYYRFPDIAKIQLKAALTAANPELVNRINQFCKRYDISL